MHKTYFISGADSGIGLALADALAKEGHRVFATAPTPEQLQTLVGRSAHIHPLLLDLRNDAHIAALKPSVLQHCDHLDGLINNAGIGLAGPIELLDLDALRDSFQINVFGHLAVTQALLPLLRRAQQGRIVFTGSMAGFLSIPLASAYSASKFSLRAFCDALRIELRPQNIRVSLIQPGSIKTPIWSRQPFKSLDGHPQLHHYKDEVEKAQRDLPRMGAKGAPVAIVTTAITHALHSRYPRARYLVGLDARLAFLARLLPPFIFDRLLGWMMR